MTVLDQKPVRRTLLANGYEPIPIRGKAPTWNGWAASAITDARLAEIEAAHPDHTNTGIRTGRCAAIDIDLTDEAHAADIEKVIGAHLAETYLRRVGSKGALLCYRNETPLKKITIGTKEKRLVEFLGEGQQFAAYGIHPSTGKAYDWPNDFFGGEPAQTPLADLPEVTPDALRTAAQAVAAKLRELGYGAVTISEAGAATEAAPPSPASGSPVTAALVANMLRAIPPSCDRNQWLTVCSGIRNAPVADPDWNALDSFERWSRGDLHGGITPANFDSEEDCEREWARDQDKQAKGEAVPQFGALVNLAREHGYAGPSFAISTQETFAAFLTSHHNSGPVSFGDVLARQVPPVQEIIAGLVERGTVTFLSAPGGSHKSRLAVQWGLLIDAGLPIFGRAVEQSRFVYVSYEDHADEVARRAQAIARRLSIPLGSEGQFWDLSGRDSPLAVVHESGECETRPFWEALHESLTAHAGHKFLVIDSTYNALRFEGAAKINEGAVMAGIGLLQRLCNETNSTMLVLWHPSQAGQERGDASGWSVAWHNAPRARLSITPVKDVEDAFDLKVEKRNHGPKGKPLTLHWSDGVLLPRGETDTAEQESRLQQSVARVAIMAAEQGVPIQRKGNLLRWHLEEIEREIGRRPTQREAKETLAAALPRGALRYVSHTRHRMAGYYPADEETAATLANAAKRIADGQVTHV